MAIYVDDLLIVGLSIEEISSLKVSLSKEFHMTDLGAYGYYLGMTVRRDRPNRRIYLRQRAYIEKILRDHHIYDTKPVNTLIETTIYLIKADDNYYASNEFKL